MIMVRQHMNCNAPLFSQTDYDFIMQCENERPRKKVLDELMDKYKTSMKRIYQIWRGEEANHHNVRPTETLCLLNSNI